MNDTTDADVTDELADDSVAHHAQQRQCSFRCSLDDNYDDDDDDDDDDDTVDYMPQILIVSQVPDAVFEDQQAQVINACYMEWIPALPMGEGGIPCQA